MAIIKTTNRSISGTILPANLGSGTASSSTVLYGDSSFKAEPSYDDNKVVNDISTLALHQATNNNSAKYNLTNSNVDVYQDSTAIANLTNCSRDTSGEYVSSIYSETATADAGGTETDITTSLINEYNTNMDIAFQNGNDIGYTSNSYNYSAAMFNALLTGNFVCQYTGTSNDYGDRSNNDQYYEFGVANAGANFLTSGGTPYSNADSNCYWAGFSGDNGPRIKFWRGTTTSLGSDSATPVQTQSCRWARMGSTLYYQVNDVTVLTVSSANFNSTANMYFWLAFSVATGNRYIQNCVYRSGMTAIKGITGDVTNATGSYESTAQTANASVSTMSGVVTYTNNKGTATLNTDIILQVSADNGSNWANATLTAAGTFSSGVLQAVTNDITVTAGTQLKYKMSFANQASASKETRINGVSLSY